MRESAEAVDVVANMVADTEAEWPMPMAWPSSWTSVPSMSNVSGRRVVENSYCGLKMMSVSVNLPAESEMSLVTATAAPVIERFEGVSAKVMTLWPSVALDAVPTEAGGSKRSVEPEMELQRLKAARIAAVGELSEVMMVAPLRLLSPARV